MPIIPLIHRLRRQAHKAVAVAQDLLVMEVYRSFPEAVLHGGTAIWRCYGSARFSEDIDVYLPMACRGSVKTKSFLADLKNRGFTAVKFREKERSIFSVFTYAGATVRFEAVFDTRRTTTVKPFEMSDGTAIAVQTLGSRILLKEKIAAYSKRRKIRDLYDIWFLLREVSDRSAVRNQMRDFLLNFKEPLDVADLKALIIVGAVPTVENMLEEIRRWAG